MNNSLSNFPSNRKISGYSSDQSNSDFELISGISPKISMNSGLTSPREDVRFSPSPPNNILNNYDRIQQQMMELNQNQPINQLLIKENEKLKRQLEGIQRELDQNRAVMAKILACQIEGKRKERQEAGLRNATARIVNLQYDILVETNSSSPPTPPIPSNVINFAQSDNNSSQQQQEIPAFDMWREHEDEFPVENGSEEHRNAPQSPLDIWRKTEEEKECEEENMKSENGITRNDIWAETDEEPNGEEILIDLNSSTQCNIYNKIVKSNNENIVNPQIPFDIIMDGVNMNDQNNNVQEHEQLESSGITNHQQPQEQRRDNHTPDQQSIHSCDQYSTIHSCDEYESALSGSRQGPPISLILSSYIPGTILTTCSSSTTMSELPNQMSYISGISSSLESNQFPPANQIVENLIGQRQIHFEPYLGNEQQEEQNEINRQNSQQINELNQEIMEIRAEMRNQNENIGTRIDELEERFANFPNVLFEMNIRLDQIETRMELMSSEQNHRIASTNLDFIGRLLNLEQKMRRIEESGTFRNAFLLEYANQIGENNYNQKLLIRIPFTYSDEFKQLIFSGTPLGFNGIVVNATAKIRNYPADFLNSIIRNALNSHNSVEMIRLFVINYPSDQKPQWPECLARIERENNIFDLPTTSSNQPIHRLQIIKKRAIREDKVIYSLRNLHSQTKFILEVYFDLQEDIYRKPRCFTIRSL